MEHPRRPGSGVGHLRSRQGIAWLLLLAACATDEPGPSGEPTERDASLRPDGKVATTDAGMRRDAGDATRPPVNTPPTTDDRDSCASVSSRAEPRLLPVDIVWAIDTSGSMTASFPAIQQALTSFSQRVSDAGIDAHIVLLAGASLCVPAPVGSGMCGIGLGGGPGVPGGLLEPGSAPDSKPPGFLHLDVPFGYGEGMPVILDNYPYYRELLRADARTHLVLTEDGSPGASADAVVERIEGRGAQAWSPGLAPDSWNFHGVVCKNGVGGGACLLAVIPPTTTLQLVERSGGIAADLALAGSGMDPFTELLDELAARVIIGAELSCEYEIPAVPNGQTFDRNLVNVSVTSTQAASRTLPQAKSDACADNQAWAYDNDQDPKKIILCPAACDTLRAQADAALDVQFGCETVVLL
jgi:hypothetical protein